MDHQKEKNQKSNNVIKWNMEIGSEIFSDFENCRLIEKSTKVIYYNIACAFDIESTTLPYHKEKDDFILDKKYWKDWEEYINKPVAFMYHWQFGLKYYDNELIIYGRYWEEFIHCIDKLIEALNISENKRLVIYVHDLAYEFQFIQYLFDWEQIFARKPRSVMKALTSCGIEFRCSYYLSNMNLAKFCQNTENVIHGKMLGDLDYRKVRFPWTRLTVKEFNYTINDVWGLMECIWELISKEDNIVTIPLTNTGYVRREVRSACFLSDPYYHKLIHEGFIWDDLYKLCRKVFRGGDTHADRVWVNKALVNIKSKDLKSSYPAVMEYEDFPTGKAWEVEIETLEDFNRYFVKQKMLGVMEIEFFNIEIKDNIAMPYIDLAHVGSQLLYEGDKNDDESYIDNGRLLRAYYITYYCTNIDLDIIFNTYDMEGFKVKKCYVWGKEKLPLPIRQKVSQYFIAKTELDGIEEKKYEYMKSKKRVNSNFGMMVTALDNDDIIYDDGDWKTEKVDLHSQLQRNYRSGNTFLLYQWGVFITAYARRNLHTVLDKMGHDAVYVDTDCIKYMGDCDQLFDEYNKNIIRKMKESDVQTYAYTKKKEKMILGVWEDDGCYSEFKTLGAKKYCIKKGNEYVITVSGMNKEKGSKKIHSLDDFSIGKTFDDIGRTTAFYNDDKPVYKEIDGHRLLITSNVAILDTTYTLGVTDTYLELLLKFLD